MNIDRVTRLVDVILPPIKPHAFNMKNWRSPCGTVLCAFGHACLDPVFKDEGLSLDGHWPEFEGEYDYEAAALFFDISVDRASNWFSPRAYLDRPTVGEVVARIRTDLQEARP